MRNKKIFKMAILALMGAILLIMMFTPLGYVPVGLLRITTMHIPVIITALVLGKKAGMLMGLLFGISSVVINTIQPTLTSFVFSPFITVGTMQGNLSSLVIAIIPRVLLGLVSGIVYEKLNQRFNETIVISTAASLGALTNTILVLGGIYIFFGPAYALARGVEYSALFTILMTTILTNGVLEIIMSIIASVVIVKIIKTKIRF